MFHDVKILKSSWVEENCRQLFINNNYYKYVFNNQGYTSPKKYIIHGFSKVETRCMDLPHGVDKTFNRQNGCLSTVNPITYNFFSTTRSPRKPNTLDKCHFPSPVQQSICHVWLSIASPQFLPCGMVALGVGLVFLF